MPYSIVEGAGLYVWGKLTTISNVNISNNGAIASRGLGGGLCLAGDNATITSSNITNNYLIGTYILMDLIRCLTHIA